MRYEVVSVRDGTYADKDLFVIHSCPGVAPNGHGGRFTIGSTHNLRLEQANPRFANSWVDSFVAGAPRYHARPTRVSSN